MASESRAAALRHWLVVRLVRWMDRGWTASYSAYVRVDSEGFPSWWRMFWTWVANRIEHIAMPLARRLDPTNRWLGQELAECGWWG